MTSTASRLQDRPYELLVFDVRTPGAVERLGAGHTVLIAPPSRATQMAKRKTA